MRAGALSIAPSWNVAAFPGKSRLWISTAGLRLDGVTGLATGDYVRILLTPDLSVEGTIACSVWHKAGVKLSRPLAENDEIYMYLADQAAAIELARTRAVVALAQQHASRARQPDTD